MRLVLDTSVVVSAVRSAEGASRFLVQAASERRFSLQMSVPLAFEYESVLSRPRHLHAAKMTPADAEGLILALLAVSHPVYLDPYTGPPLPDVVDHHVLNLVMQSRADALVTYNTRHFSRACAELGVLLYQPGRVISLLQEG